MIYLIAGRGRSGKNTFGSYLREELEKRGRKVCNIEISRTLKGYIRDYFGWDGTDEAKPRDLLQQIGTGIIREKMNMPLFHIRRLQEDILILSNFFDDFIVDDVRFPIEIETLRKENKNVYAVLVEREGEFSDGMTKEQREHITETALHGYEGYDQKIQNRTLEGLRKDAEAIVKEVEKHEKYDK